MIRRCAAERARLPLPLKTEGQAANYGKMSQRKSRTKVFAVGQIALTSQDVFVVRWRYVLKQKFWSSGDDFRIQDADGQDVFFVDGRAFSWGDKLSFRDMAKNELAFIRQKLLAWGPTYEIEVHGRLVAVVKKKLFTLLRCKFTLDVPGPEHLEAQGSFLDHEYTFERQGREVAPVSKRWFSWTDTYGVDIAVVRMTCSF